MAKPTSNQNQRQALLQSLASQQKVIDSLREENARQASLNELRGIEIDYIARVAGITPEIDAIRATADIANPASPVPDPASSGPSETTEQAATPEARDDAQALGETPGSVAGVPADSTDVALNPGESLPTAPFGQVTDVTSPVAGTETQLPLDQTRIETDVRVGDPDNPEPAFPWTLSAKDSRERTLASLRLARLRISAGIASGEDIMVASAIEADASLSNDLINNEINVLANVSKVASRQPRPTGLVPRSASAERTVPSLVGDAAPSLSTTAGLDDTADADLFY
jgi:hypothetical protein